MGTELRFEEEGGRLRAISVGTTSRAPLVSRLHQTLFALGITVASYHAQASPSGLRERLVLERTQGGGLDPALSQEAKLAVLPLMAESQD